MVVLVGNYHSRLPSLDQRSGRTPYVAGLVALLFQAVPTMEPGEVVQLLRDSASGHLARERWEQGAGLVQADVALELALERDKAKRTSARPECSPLPGPTSDGSCLQKARRP